MNNPLYVAIVINVLVWAYVILCLYRSKGVKYECQVGAKIVIVLLFFGAGLLIYVNDIQGYGIYNFMSLGIAGLLYYLVKSGIGEEGFYVLGRLFRYKDISNLKLENLGNKIGLKFDYRHRSRYLFVKEDKVKELKKNLDQYYYHR